MKSKLVRTNDAAGIFVWKIFLFRVEFCAQVWVEERQLLLKVE